MGTRAEDGDSHGDYHINAATGGAGPDGSGPGGGGKWFSGVVRRGREIYGLDGCCPSRQEHPGQAIMVYSPSLSYQTPMARWLGVLEGLSAVGWVWERVEVWKLAGGGLDGLLAIISVMVLLVLAAMWEMVPSSPRPISLPMQPGHAERRTRHNELSIKPTY